MLTSPESSFQFLKKLGIELPYDPETSKYTPKRTESTYPAI